MAVKTVFEYEVSRNIGLSTDTKPHGQRPLSTFYEYDTFASYITYDGTNWVVDTSVGSLGGATPFEVRVTKNILIGGAYGENDVVSEATTNGTGTDWDFEGMAAADGGYGVIDTVTIVSQTPNISPRLPILLFNAPPTGELDDNAANTSPVDADLAKVIPFIDSPALTHVGTSSNSWVVISSSTVGGLPILYKCAAGSTTLYGILTTRDIFTQTAKDNMTIIIAGRHF